MKLVTLKYGKIPSYRNPSRLAWGFSISDPDAAFGRADVYTCSRRSAPRVFEQLRGEAENRGFTVNLEVDPISGLGEDLRPVLAS